MRFKNAFTGEKVTILDSFIWMGQERIKYKRDNPQQVGVLKMIEDKLTQVGQREQSEFVKPKYVFDATHVSI